MAQLQRARILAAMASACRQRGTAPATVSEVCERANVSRRTFYEMFSGREDCFMAALEDAIARSQARLREACRTQSGWAQEMRAGLEAFLQFVVEDTDFAGLIVFDALGAGWQARHRRAEAIRLVASAIDRGRAQSPREQALSPLTAQALAGAVLSVLQARLTAGAKAQELLALSGQLASILVLPYLGPRAAERELARAAGLRGAGEPAAGRRRAAPGAGEPAAPRLRLTARTIEALLALQRAPGASNDQIAAAIGIRDRGQASKLLARLAAAGLAEKEKQSELPGQHNRWRLTELGDRLACEARAGR